MDAKSIVAVILVVLILGGIVWLQIRRRKK